MKIYTKSLLFLLLYVTFTAAPALAADVQLITNKTSLGVGEGFLVSVRINSAESLNAVEGKVVFTPESFSVRDIRYGNSVINFWVDSPEVQQDGSIHFSGITPGGFNGENKEIFSFVVEPRLSGSQQIGIKDLQVFLNDGSGMKASINTQGLTVSISPEQKNTNEKALVDNEMPERFWLSIANDPNLFDGQYFLVFATQDKISGIAKYQVKEGVFGRFVDAESPYVLKDQKLTKKIFVKAIDKSGNERLATLNAIHQQPWYLNYVVIGISLILITLLLFGSIKNTWSRFIK